MEGKIWRNLCPQKIGTLAPTSRFLTPVKDPNKNSSFFYYCLNTTRSKNCYSQSLLLFFSRMSVGKDVSPAQDGGILKEVTKEGLGEVTPSYGSEASYLISIKRIIKF